MKKWIIITIIIAAPAIALAADAAPVAKLPYAKGQNFIVTQGYDTPPTHIKKDSYALDFTQNGCDAYRKAVVAAASGTAMFLSQEGYNGGYGTELIVDHGNNIVSRYAHMIPDSIAVAADGAVIRQGQTVGLIGDTGLVAGAACTDHPGTHLHFAMDTVNADGTFSAYDPEPISGYTNMLAGKWYLSDNGEDDAGDVATTATAAVSILPTIAPSVSTTSATGTIAIVSPLPPISPLLAPSSPPPGSAVPIGGVSVMSPNISPPPISPSDPSEQNTPSTGDDADTSTTASTTASTSDTTTISTPETPSSTVPSSSPATSTSDIFFEQPDDGAVSPASWYDDNWFELGSGFAGMLNTLTLEGKVSDQNYFASQVTLQEFKDKNYTAMVQEFPISDNAPFTPVMATTTFSGLSIPLKPYFYYRLTTVQDWQNRSVLLAGTATTTTGTVMWDNFIYGTGRVESTAPFFPFMVMEGVAATSTATPPPITTPTNVAANFDELGMQLNLSWSTSTDPDWPANPLHYEVNYSTSTSFSDSGWGGAGPIPVAVGNSYLIGVRAEDGYGGMSAIATTTWSFPPGFTPYLLSPELGYANQYFTVPSTSTLQSIELFTTNFQTNAKNPDAAGCSLAFLYPESIVSVGMQPADNSYSGYGCAGHLTYSFASSSIPLVPGKQYQWIFEASTGNPSTGADVQFYGTATDTAGGGFNDSSLVNAKFVVNGDSGVLFAN
jgi:hypothetical protein